MFLKIEQYVDIYVKKYNIKVLHIVMNCIYCKHSKTSVENSRAKTPSIIWRRRLCQRCGMKFTTEETPQGNNLFITKRSGKRQRFIYEKLITSLVYAFEKGKGSDHGDQALYAKKVAKELIAHMMEKNRKEITSALLITLCYSALLREYPFAAERYMHYSLYREKTCAPLRAREERAKRQK